MWRAPWLPPTPLGSREVERHAGTLLEQLRSSHASLRETVADLRTEVRGATRIRATKQNLPQNQYRTTFGEAGDR